VGLPAGFGQQWLLHHHDGGRTRDVQSEFDDVVAMACRPSDDSTWMLRRVTLPSAQEFRLVRMQLVLDPGPTVAAPRLLPQNVSMPDVLAGMFEENPDIAPSPTDAYTLAVSATGTVFVLFALVPAQHRYMMLLHDNGERIAPLCALLTEYRGLDGAFISSAWTTGRSLVLHMQDSIFTARCDGARLVLRHEPQALPNRRFAQLGTSYLSLMGLRQLRLSSELRSGNLALEPLLPGFCVFVSPPNTTLTVTSLPNAYLRDTRVVLDTRFDPEALVDSNALGGLEAVHSPRGLSLGAAHVTARPQPEAVLQRHPLHAHMRRLHALGVPRLTYWNATTPHLVELQITLPCGAELRMGTHTLQARTSSADYACRAAALYVRRNLTSGGIVTCVLCNASACAIGAYLAGANCSECRACERRALVNGLFMSSGALDEPGSCAEQCPPGRFADFEQCVEHSQVTRARRVPARGDRDRRRDVPAVRRLPRAPARRAVRALPQHRLRAVPCARPARGLCRHQLLRGVRLRRATRRRRRVRDVRGRVPAGHLPRLLGRAHLPAVRAMPAAARAQQLHRGVQLELRRGLHAAGRRRTVRA